MEPLPSNQSRLNRDHPVGSLLDGGGDPSELQGLSDGEVESRRRQYGLNELPAEKKPGPVRLVLGQFRNPLSLLLGLAIVFGIVAGDIEASVVIVFVLLINAGVGAFQGGRAQSAIDTVAELSAPRAVVIRSGEARDIAAREVVPDDLVVLNTGDVIPADLRLVEVTGLEIDESILTGESEPTRKVVGYQAPSGASVGDRRGEAFASTIVLVGRALGRVTATGASCEVGKITAAVSEPPPSPLEKELRQAAFRLGGASLTIGLLLIAFVYLRSSGGRDAAANALLAGIAMAVAAIPSGLPAVITSSLALGARRMAAEGAIVRRLPSIEALGSASVLCTDKTGTITTGRPAVASTESVGDRSREMWAVARRCNDSVGEGGDPIDDALLTASTAELGENFDVGIRIYEAPFDPVTRLMTTVHSVGGDAVISLKGAPEDVLRICSDASADQLRPGIDRLTESGSRVLALAGRTIPSSDWDGPESIPVELEALGAIGFEDPIRESALDAVADCRRAGIRLVLVTGDHLKTAMSVARSAGMDEEPAFTGEEIERHVGEDRASMLRRAAVVARVDPELKVELVAAHQATGNVVAMTGDGVNDAPALRTADVGVGIAGRGGSDVAREASDLIVTNRDLNTIVVAISEGRRIYRNLAAVVSYLYTGNLSEVLVVMSGLILLPELPVPLLPIQLLLVNLLTDSVPGLALGTDVAPDDPLARPPRDPEVHLLSGKRQATLIAMGALIATLVMVDGGIAHSLGWEPGVIRTQLLVALVLCHLSLAYVSRSQRHTFEAGWARNSWLIAAIGSSTTILVAVVVIPTLRSLLRLEPLPGPGWVMAICTAGVFVALIDALRAVRRWRQNRVTAPR